MSWPRRWEYPIISLPADVTPEQIEEVKEWATSYRIERLSERVAFLESVVQEWGGVLLVEGRLTINDLRGVLGYDINVPKVRPPVSNEEAVGTP